MIFGFVGSITIEHTARLAMKSSTGSQLWPPSSVRQTPPPTLPTQMRFEFVG